MGTLCVKICSLDKGERECAKFLIVKRLMCQNILLLDNWLEQIKSVGVK